MSATHSNPNAPEDRVAVAVRATCRRRLRRMRSPVDGTLRDLHAARRLDNPPPWSPTLQQHLSDEALRRTSEVSMLHYLNSPYDDLEDLDHQSDDD